MRATILAFYPARRTSQPLSIYFLVVKEEDSRRSVGLYRNLTLIRRKRPYAGLDTLTHTPTARRSIWVGIRCPLAIRRRCLQRQRDTTVPGVFDTAGADNVVRPGDCQFEHHGGILFLSRFWGASDR